MGKLIKLEDHIYPWKEAFAVDGEASALQLYVNEYTGEAEIVQSNDDGEVMRTVLTPANAALLREAIKIKEGKTAK